MSLDKDNLKAAIARAEAAERKLRDTQKLDVVKVNPTNEAGLADRHLLNIQSPPNKIRFAKVSGLGQCTILTDDDRPELGMAYLWKDGWWGRCRVVVACVANEKVWEYTGYRSEWVWKWVKRRGTKQVFKGKLAREIKLALQALHIRTRAKGPV